MTPNILPPSIRSRPPLTIVTRISPMEMDALIAPALAPPAWQLHFRHQDITLPRQAGRLTAQEQQFIRLVVEEGHSYVAAYRLSYPPRNGTRSPVAERVAAGLVVVDQEDAGTGVRSRRGRCGLRGGLGSHGLPFGEPRGGNGSLAR